MKTRNWSVWLAAAVLVVGALTATSAEAINFGMTFDGCSGDTVFVSPILANTPDSIQWNFCAAPPSSYVVTDTVGPWDTLFTYGGYTGYRADSVCMHAWYAGFDSTVYKIIWADYIVAVPDGRDCNENDSVIVSELANDSLFFATVDSVIIWDTTTYGPFHGTAYVDTLNRIVYKVDPGYNGTDIMVYEVWNNCMDSDTATVAITILSDGLIAFDSCWYQWIDVPCACDDSADGLGTISVGDSFRVCTHIPTFDLDELSSGWPHVDLPGIAGTGLGMEQNPNLDVDSGLFCWPGWEADSTPTWFEITPGNLDVAAGFYEIYSRARSDQPPNLVAACTTIVNEAIDNNDPDIGGGEASWVLWNDINGDGVATTNDTMRFYVDLRNEPFEEICQVCAWTTGFPTDADTLYPMGCLYEIAGDNRWAMVFEVPPGNLEDPDGPFTVLFRYTDNACNVDSVTAVYSDPVDNTAPTCANIETSFEALTDLDSNNCISLGETVRIEITDTNTINNDVTYWLDLLSDSVWRLGLGVDDSTNIWQDSVPMNNLGGGVWRLDWTLGKYPLANAIDTSALAGSHPWVYLHAVDDAGNSFSCDSLAIVWSDANPNIDELDARAPDSVHIVGCFEDTTFIGTRAVRIRFTNIDVDVARFRMFYDDGSGVIDYVDTLAGLSWADTAGGSGTDGLIRVNDTTWDWTTDGTVELSWCRDYLFNIWVLDSCGNLECMHPDSIMCPGENPDPVDSLTCESMDAKNICLRWRGFDASVDSFCVFMSTNGVLDTAMWVTTVDFVDTATVYGWCTDDAGLDLLSNVWYDFIVIPYDSCGNAQEDDDFGDFEDSDPWVTQCIADDAAPRMCVFQPEPGGMYSCDNCDIDYYPGENPDGFYFYLAPCNDTSVDNTAIDSILIRIADSAGAPSEWMSVPFNAYIGPNHWQIKLDCSVLDNIVRMDDSVEVLEVMAIAEDGAGRVTTRDEVQGCCGLFDFTWSAQTVDVEITLINDEIMSYQPYCDFHGWEPIPGVNTVEVCIDGGTPPYKIKLESEDSFAEFPDGSETILYVENVYAACTTFTFIVDGYFKGDANIDVTVCDAFGHSTDEVQADLCIPDTTAPCGIISYPVDGKCIRRSRSMLDPVDVCVTIDPKGIDIDPDNILKIDFQWARECCIGTVKDTICEEIPCLIDSSSFVQGSLCSTFVAFDSTICYDIFGPTQAEICSVFVNSQGLDSIRCISTTVDTSCTILNCHLEDVPCENQFPWETIAIVPGNVPPPEKAANEAGDVYCTTWWNTEDLAWITESGTNIFLRAVIYDEQGNTCITPCVQVCIDIDTPPMCLWSPDICYKGDTVSIGGSIDMYAELDFSQGNVDDIEDVTLWYKRSVRPDIPGEWTQYDGSGFLNGQGTNSTVWEWKDISICEDGFLDQTWYDFRVQVKTIWGTYSWDLNGDGWFDANTFDTTECDMVRWFVDCMAPEIAFDTVWTMINDELLVEPNVSCALSDPRGWAWAQFGKDITLQTSVFPLGEIGSIERVEYSIWDGDCAECDCLEPSEGQVSMGNFSVDGTCDYKVFAIREGSHSFDHVTFNPAELGLDWINVTDGFQQHTLRVRAWDGCGNMTEDCVELYLLDVDTTDAIVIEPMGDQVFCQDHSEDGDGGCIAVSAASIMGESMEKVVFYYRAVGGTDWIPIDSVEAELLTQKIVVEGPSLSNGIATVYWCPHALGLPDGAYELTAVAIDGSLNRAEPGVYVTRVFLACDLPEVTLIHPSEGNPPFLGCEIELEALATSSNPYNPVEYVRFYIQKATDGGWETIGTDYNSPDGSWYYVWDPKDWCYDDKGDCEELDGPYFIWACAYNKAGAMVESEKVLVKFDNTDPYAEIIEVNGDHNPDDEGGPDIIVGDDVDIWAHAWDVDGEWGYGEADNCGVDSVLMYVKNRDDKIVVFGVQMTRDPNVDTLYHTVWSTSNLVDMAELGIIDQATGEYKVWIEAYDCACNSYKSSYWYFTVVAPQQELTLSIDGAVEICDTLSIGGPDLDFEICVHVPQAEFVDFVEIWAGLPNASDVHDQYIPLTCVDKSGYYCLNETTNPDGSADWCISVDMYELEEIGLVKDGGYRLRAFAYFSDGTVSDDYNDDGKFDDFTFNEANPHHMIVRVDNSITDITVEHDETVKAHENVDITVTPDQPCDVDEMCFELATHALRPEDDGEWDDLDSCLSNSFDPLDSGLVSLTHGVWSGAVITHVMDALGNGCSATGCDGSSEVITELWVLDMDDDQVRITSPSYDGYMIGDSGLVVARKLSSATIDSVRFFYSTTQAGAGTYIGSDNSADGDEFMVYWQLPEEQGLKWIWGTAYSGGTADASPYRCPVTTAGQPDPFSLHILGGEDREVLGQTLTFVGRHADLCLDRDSISTIVDGIGIDSVVWYFRNSDVVGESEPTDSYCEHLDAYEGWVRIGMDIYGSLCTDWWPDWCQILADSGCGEYSEYLEDCCSDGRYTIVAYVYDKAGQAYHSVPKDVMIDVTDPMTEIIDIDGDETFGTCHAVALPGDSVIHITAVAADDQSCAGSDDQFNSGAKYLQFFAGYCDGTSEPVDLLFVVDGSRSMWDTGDEIDQLAGQASELISDLYDVDVRIGVMGFDGETYSSGLGQYITGRPINTSGNYEDWTSSQTDWWTSSTGSLVQMILGVKNIPLQSVSGQTDNNYEFGLAALENACNYYNFRSEARKILVLVTDEDADDSDLWSQIGPGLIANGGVIHTILNLSATTGYSTLAPSTGGLTFDVNASWSATISALTSSIVSSAGDNPAGIIWGEQVAFNDVYGEAEAVVDWNISGLEPGTYCVWSNVVDAVGNTFESEKVEVCIEDRTPPVAYIAGFGRTLDEHMMTKHYIYAQSWHDDIEKLQFQYRVNSESEEDWVTIGIGTPINGSNMCWLTTWNPCQVSGELEMRAIAYDYDGNVDFDAAPIAYVTVTPEVMVHEGGQEVCMGTVAPSGPSLVDEGAMVWFEDRTFENLGLVNVMLSSDETKYHQSMLASWQDRFGGLAVEKIDLWTPDPDDAMLQMGSFDGTSGINLGGEGWFWTAFNDGDNVTHLYKEMMTVWRVDAATGGCSGTHPTLGAKVCIEPGALTADNGIVIFPARNPVVDREQQHYYAWPAWEKNNRGLMTAIRLTEPFDGDFRTGKYAHITIGHTADESLDPASDLGVAWWDDSEGEWNNRWDIVACGESGEQLITSSTAKFCAQDLHGVYAVVSGTRVCNTGAVQVDVRGAVSPSYSNTNVVGPWPKIETVVKSSIEGINGNSDIKDDDIIVILDEGTDNELVLWSNDDNPDNEFYYSYWDETSGILTTTWNHYGCDDYYNSEGDYYYLYCDEGYDSEEDYSLAPPLTAGTHTYTVRAFNRSGFCGEDTWTFTVDNTPPDVEVETGYVCRNPTFNIKITDNDAGVKWDRVFVDVYGLEASGAFLTPKARLMHTEVWDAFNDGDSTEWNSATGEFSFTLTLHDAQYRRYGIVIYDGNRCEDYNGDCNCEHYTYNNICDGVVDNAGNHQRVVREVFTISDGECGKGGDQDDEVTIATGSTNPFDPYAGEKIGFSLAGFDGGGRVEVNVYDLAGNKVGTIYNSAVNNVTSTVFWAGTNDDGDLVAEGVYLVHFKTSGSAASGASSQVLKVVVKRAN